MNLTCLFGHKWNGCTCEKCGEKRDEKHKMIALEGKCMDKCSVCGEEREVKHEWNGCKCERCQVIRDWNTDPNYEWGADYHKWVISDGTCTKKCSVCGEEDESEHKWWNEKLGLRGCTCLICGKKDTDRCNYSLIPGDECHMRCSCCGEIIPSSENHHQWIMLENCRKRCDKCGRIAYDHNYTHTGTTGNPYGESEDNFKCSKCGHEAYRSSRADSGGREYGTDTRQYGIIKSGSPL